MSHPAVFRLASSFSGIDGIARHRRGLRRSVVFAMLLLAVPAGNATAASGDLDTSFDGDGYAITPIGSGYERAESVAIQDDGKIVAAGITDVSFAVARYNANGSLDTSFDTDGKVATVVGDNAASIEAIAIQEDGKILAVGSAFVTDNAYDFALARYNPDGSLDASFDTDGIVLTNINGSDVAVDVAIQSDDKIVVVGVTGSNFDFVVARYNPNGSLDTSFDGDGLVFTTFPPNPASVRAVALQADGKIVVAGAVNSTFTVARYLTGGTLDPDFGEDGFVIAPVGAVSIPVAVEVRGDGRIVVGGYASMPDTEYDYAVVRLLADGTLDSSFGDGGIATTAITTDSDILEAMTINSSGQIVLAGTKGDDVFFNTVLVRLDPDGSPDAFFGTAGVVTLALTAADDFARSLAIQDDGAIVAVGQYDTGASVDFLAMRFIGGCEVCNDGTLCTADSCDVMLECQHEPDPIPEVSCLTSAKSRLQIKAGETPDKNKLQWKWSNGEAFDQAALGSPDDDTIYELCIYDATAGTPSVATSLVLESGSSWESKDPNGFRYDDKAGVSDGVGKLTLKTGEMDKTKAQLKASGVNLPMPVAFSLTELFEQDPEVLAQLVSSTGTCLTSSFATADTDTNEADSFKAQVK